MDTMDTFNYSEVAWSGPICVKYDPEHGVIQFEAWSAVNGISRCVRSFSLYTSRLNPGALAVLEAALAKRRDSTAYTRHDNDTNKT